MSRDRLKICVYTADQYGCGHFRMINPARALIEQGHDVTILTPGERSGFRAQVDREGRIVRVEVLDGRYLYAIRIYTPGDSFNLCPADVCQSVDGAELARPACAADAPKNKMRVESYTPPPEIIQAVERIMVASGIELGGVEYMIDDRDGRLYFYDVNQLSNFVADAPRVIGFDPFARLADWLEAELARAGAAAGEVV